MLMHAHRSLSPFPANCGYLVTCREGQKDEAWKLGLNMVEEDTAEDSNTSEECTFKVGELVEF
jgi:hypothetical protein